MTTASSSLEVPIAIVDDDPNLVASLSTLMRLSRPGWQPHTFTSSNAALRYLRAQPAAVVVSDWDMPGMDGLELCESVVREHPEGVYRFVMISGRASIEQRARALEESVSDFLVKPFDTLDLLARITSNLREVQKERRAFERYRRLESLVRIDPLTQALNRHGLQSAWERELQRAERDALGVGLICVDVDRFKDINDRIGHRPADEVLVELVRRMRTATRPYDHVARFGGDEWVVICPAVDEHSLQLVAQRIWHEVRRVPMPTSAGPVEVSVSLGTCLRPQGATTRFEEIFELADRAMYDAKRGGRDRVAVGMQTAGRDCSHDQPSLP